jgi:hypothetical protein
VQGAKRKDRTKEPLDVDECLVRDGDEQTYEHAGNEEGQSGDAESDPPTLTQEDQLERTCQRIGLKTRDHQQAVTHEQAQRNHAETPVDAIKPVHPAEQRLDKPQPRPEDDVEGVGRKAGESQTRAHTAQGGGWGLEASRGRGIGRPESDSAQA